MKKEPAPVSPEEKSLNAEVGGFLKGFCELWSEAHDGGTYRVVRTKDVPLVKALLKDYGLARLGRLAERLMDSEETWIAGTDRGLGVLAAAVNRLEAEECADARRTGDRGQPPGGAGVSGKDAGVVRAVGGAPGEGGDDDGGD